MDHARSWRGSTNCRRRCRTATSGWSSCAKWVTNCRGPKRTSCATESTNCGSVCGEFHHRIRLGIPTRRIDMAKRTKPAIDAVEILHRRFYASKPARLKNLEEARANEEIARADFLRDGIYELRV